MRQAAARQTYETPESCSEVGLDCRSCTEASAGQLAQACPGMNGKMVGQLFVQLHVQPGCSKMHAHFAKAYRQALIARDDIAEAASAGPLYLVRAA